MENKKCLEPPTSFGIITLNSPNLNCLVVYLPLWKMMEFVSWDDDILNMMGKIKCHVPNHQPVKVNRTFIPIVHLPKIRQIMHTLFPSVFGHHTVKSQCLLVKCLKPMKNSLAIPWNHHFSWSTPTQHPKKTIKKTYKNPPIRNWLVVSTPLKNDGVRQLGWWHSQYIYIYMMGKIIHSCSKPPTNSWFNIHRKVLHLSSRIPGWFPCRLQHGRRFQAPSPVFRHAAARGAAAQGRLEAEDEGQLAKLGDNIVL